MLYLNYVSKTTSFLLLRLLLYALGIDRRSLWDIENGLTNKDSGMSDIIKNAKGFIATMEAELARDGEINSTVYIFRAKNYFGMVDKQEVVVSPNTGMNAQLNAEDIVNNVPTLEEGK